MNANGLSRTPRPSAPAAGCVVAVVLALLAPAANAQTEANTVLVDTSPPLLASDFAAIRSAAQFALGAWLTLGESERLRKGLIEEWLVCDAQGRDQILEFAAAARELAAAPEEGRSEAGAQVLEGMKAAHETGRPLGQAFGELLASTTVQVCPSATEHDAAAWLEMQEAGLATLLAAPIRIPRALGREMVLAAAKSEPDELAEARQVWAHLRAASAAAGPEGMASISEALASALSAPRAEEGDAFEDPIGLYRFTLPAGYEAAPGAGGPDTHTFAHRAAAGGGRVLAVAVSEVPESAGMEPGALAKALDDRLASGGPCADLVPRSEDRAIAAAALVERGGRWIWLCLLRAPGDTALVSLVAICSPADSVAMASEIAVVLRTLAFRDEVWTSNADWEIARPSAMPTDSPSTAPRRAAGAALAEATGRLAVRALGAPIGPHGVPVEDLRDALGPPQALSLFDWPGGPL